MNSTSFIMSLSAADIQKLKDKLTAIGVPISGSYGEKDSVFYRASTKEVVISPLAMYALSQPGTRNLMNEKDLRGENLIDCFVALVAFSCPSSLNQRKGVLVRDKQGSVRKIVDRIYVTNQYVLRAFRERMSLFDDHVHQNEVTFLKEDEIVDFFKEKYDFAAALKKAILAMQTPRDFTLGGMVGVFPENYIVPPLTKEKLMELRDKMNSPYISIFQGVGWEGPELFEAPSAFKTVMAHDPKWTVGKVDLDGVNIKISVDQEMKDNWKKIREKLRNTEKPEFKFKDKKSHDYARALEVFGQIRKILKKPKEDQKIPNNLIDELIGILTDYSEGFKI
jgi:hypothetical protein